MGPLEAILAIVASWVAVVLVFTAGFVVGRFTFTLSGEAKTMLPRRSKTITPLKPVQGAVPGVDVNSERLKIITRAKSEHGMTQKEAEQFADSIIKQGSQILGRLHSQG